MPASKLLCELAGVSSTQFSKEENLLLEVDLFTCICLELEKEFKKQYKNYMDILKSDKEEECLIVETGFVRYIIQDILSTKEYSLLGVAYYTHAPEDVIYDIATGKIKDPSASTLRKIIELHRLVRPELYNNIMNKLINKNRNDKNFDDI